MRAIYNIAFLAATVILMAGTGTAEQPCNSWNRAYNSNLNITLMEFLGQPIYKTAYFPWPRNYSGRPPGDYYKEPIAVPGTILADTDFVKIQQYCRLIFNDEYLCEFPEAFRNYVIFMDSLKARGMTPATEIYSDSSRKEFFGKYTVNDNLIFISGWYDKFVLAFINVETNSIDTLFAEAGKYVESDLPPLSAFTKYEYCWYPDEIDVSAIKDRIALDKNDTTCYKFGPDENRIISVFKRNIDYVELKRNSAVAESVSRTFLVLQIAIFFDKEYMP